MVNPLISKFQHDLELGSIPERPIKTKTKALKKKKGTKKKKNKKISQIKKKNKSPIKKESAITR